jgi:hypothetical protein
MTYDYEYTNLIDKVERLEAENKRLREGVLPLVCCTNSDDLSDCAMIYQLDSYKDSLDKIAAMVPMLEEGGTVKAVEEELNRLRGLILEYAKAADRFRDPAPINNEVWENMKAACMNLYNEGKKIVL